MSLPPRIGFGTYKVVDGAVVKKALACGYRHIDTAEVYRNEELVGEAVKPYPREDLYIVSKVHPKHLRNSDVYSACVESLQRLQLDYLDLYLIHWPGAAKTAPESPDNAVLRAIAWEQMKQLVSDGLVRSIGVSNYTVKHLESMDERPSVNQIEVHPLCWSMVKDTVEYCHANDIAVVGYSSILHGRFDELGISRSALEALAKDIGSSLAQLMLIWSLSKVHAVIPKASSESHMIENLDAIKLTLTPQHIDLIDGIANQSSVKLFWNPDSIK